MVTKKCTKCGEVKDVSEFPTRKDTKSGLRASCKVCYKEYHSAYNVEHTKEKRQYNVMYNKENKLKISLQKKRYNEENKEQISAQKAVHYQENKEFYSIQNAIYRATHSDEIKKANSVWRKLNKEYIAAKNAERRAKKLQRTPNWLTEKNDKQIKDIYKECQQIKDLTGKQYHVDHIWPLQGKDVSGLHVPWNLQILSEHDNISKSNKRPDSVKVNIVTLTDFT
jgi:hypothetical protein